MTNLTFELSKGEVTTNVSGITAKYGDYSIQASYSKLDTTRAYQSINITVSFGVKTATLNQYGADSNLNYSYPYDISTEVQAEVKAILDESLKQIKTR